MGAFSPTEVFVLSFKSLRYFVENDLCINRMCAEFFEPVGDHIYAGAQSPPARNDALWRLETRRYIPSGTISQCQIISFCGDAFCCA